MLQQTQVSRVTPKYREFIRIFPTIRDLGNATAGKVIRAWSGLGYNRRALHLRAAAHAISMRKPPTFPKAYEDLIRLPGIGTYTARAVQCFAFEQRVAVLDVNVSRVLSRVFRKHKITVEFAESVLPPRRAYDWNQALMDLGATRCTARNPLCSECPLSKLCLSSGKVTVSASTSVRREPSRKGTPRRIYRGRIVSYVRQNGPASLTSVGRAVIMRYTPKDEAWLVEVIHRLEQDGLLSLVRKGRTWLVSLPK